MNATAAAAAEVARLKSQLERLVVAYKTLQRDKQAADARITELTAEVEKLRGVLVRVKELHAKSSGSAGGTGGGGGEPRGSSGSFAE